MNIVWISKIRWDMPHKTSRLKMSEALIRRGHNVTLYMVKKIGDRTFNSDNIVCIPTIPFPTLSGIFYGLIVFFYFPILLSRKKLDVIIIDFTKVWLPFLIPLRILNIPLIIDIRTLPIDRDKSFFFRISIYLSRYMIDGITTITPELNTVLRNVYNLKNKKVGFWASGVSIEDFNNAIKQNNIQVNTNNHKFSVLYHGDYSPTRGIEYVIEAISRLESFFKNKISLVIIGMPKKKINDLSKLSEKKGVKEQVNILPKVEYNKITHFINTADVGIIPLPPKNIWWRVSAPLKTLEYLAAGKPIIATNIPFHQKIFDKGNCGILLESATPEAIAKGISYLYNNQEEGIKMGKNGKKIVEKFYTWDIMARKFEDFLMTFLSRS